MKKRRMIFTQISMVFMVLLILCSLAVLPVSAEAAYFSDDFEGGLGKWSVSGSDWAIIDTDSVSPTHSVTDSPGGNYPPNSNASLTLAQPIDLTGSTSPVLSFWYKISMQCYSGCNYWDYGYLEVSTNGGLSWTVLKQYAGNISTWTNDLIDLSSYKTSSVLIRFRLRDMNGDGGADGWYIDDVEIKEKNSPILLFPFSDNFENGLGNWMVSGSDWDLIDTDSVSPTHSVTDSLDGNYPANGNATMTLAHPIDLTGTDSPVLSFWYKISMQCYSGCNYWDYGYLEVSTNGGFSWTVLKSFNGNISTWTSELIDLSSYKTSSILIRFRLRDMNGDGGADGWYIDDVEIKEKDKATLPLPFTDNFESGLGNWMVSGSAWDLIDTDSVSPTHSVTDSPDGNYPANGNATMTLAHPIDLPDDPSLRLSFWYKISMQCYSGCNYWDYGYLEISTNGGFSWTVLKSYNGNISTWTSELIDLSSYKTSSILIRFRVRDMNGDGGADGWYIDDVAIYGTQTNYFCDKDSDTYFNIFKDGTCTGANCVPAGCRTTPGDDCKDDLPAVHPGAAEGPYGSPTCSDALDNDCDGYTDISDSGCQYVDPAPDIKANGSDGPVTISPADNLSVTISLDPGHSINKNADWWIVANSPFGWFHHDLLCDCWKPSLFVTYLSPLYSLAPYEVLNMSGLPAGEFTFYFGVDMLMNGVLNMGPDDIYYDSVDVTITP